MPSSLLRYGVIAGLMAGFACGCKLTGVPTVLVALPVAAVLAALVGRFPRNLLPRLITAFVVYVAVGAAAFAPWLVRNQAWAGNPVFPEAASVPYRSRPPSL